MPEPRNFFGVVAPHAIHPEVSRVLRDAAAGRPRARAMLASVLDGARRGDRRMLALARLLEHAIHTTRRNALTRKYLAMGPRVPHALLPQESLAGAGEVYVAGPCTDSLRNAWSTCRQSAMQMGHQWYQRWQAMQARMQPHHAAGDGCGCGGSCGCGPKPWEQPFPLAPYGYQVAGAGRPWYGSHGRY